MRIESGTPTPDVVGGSSTNDPPSAGVVRNRKRTHGDGDGGSGTEVEVHPTAAAFFALCPWVRRIPIFGEATQGFGLKVVIALGGSYFCCKGIADQLISYARQPMFMKRYHINGERYQRLSGISTMGWSIKAFTAMMCDGFAFCGYTKRWYMFISCVGGAASALAYGLLPAKESSANTAAAFVFLCSYGKANVDILSEGHYSRLMRLHPKPGPALVSWIWVWIMVGAIVAAAIQGPLSDQGNPQFGVFVSAALQLTTAAFFLFNMYEEKKNIVERTHDAAVLHAELQKERAALGLVSLGSESVVSLPVTGATAEAVSSAALRKDFYSGRSQAEMELRLPVLESPQAGTMEEKLPPWVIASSEGVDETSVEDDAEYVPFHIPKPVPCLFGIFEMNTEVITRNWKIFVYSVVMTGAVVAMTCGTILADTLGLLIICVITSTVCCATSFWALPLVIAKANVFSYLQMVLYLQLPGALDSFYLASNDCVPRGPHFSYIFYNTVAAVIGNVGGLAGVVAFKYVFSQRSYRLTFCVTTAVQVIASLFDIVIVQRWNLYIGIPDHAMYIFGDAIVYQVCYQLSWMPMVVLLSRLCPRGSESVVYALMAGFGNLGQTTSSSIGAIIMEYGWPVVTTVPCDFSNVPRLLLVGHILLPLLVLPLTLLIPVARICDDLNTDGSVLEKVADRDAVAHTTRGADSPQYDRLSIVGDAGPLRREPRE